MGGSRTGLSTSSAGLESNSAFKNSFSSSRKCFELLITPEFVHAATKAVLLSSGIGWSFSSSKLHASLFHTCSGWYTFQFLVTAIWLLGTNLLFPLHYGVLHFSKLVRLNSFLCWWCFCNKPRAPLFHFFFSLPVFEVERVEIDSFLWLPESTSHAHSVLCPAM